MTDKCCHACKKYKILKVSNLTLDCKAEASEWLSKLWPGRSGRGVLLWQQAVILFGGVATGGRGHGGMGGASVSVSWAGALCHSEKAD